MTDHWLSVRVKPGSHRDAVVAALFAAGAQGVQEIDDQLVTLLADESKGDEVTCAVLAASPDASIETEPTPQVDWSERWKSALHAHQLGPLFIAPPWLAHGHDAEHSVIIDPGMAFGTGEHATTRGVIRLLPTVLRSGDRVADLGAGSAVLSIAAAKLGAAHAFAIELDPDAIGNAEENVARNGVADRVTVLEGDAEVLLPLVAPVNVVVANILSSVLLVLLPTIALALAPGGRAILSGILREERREILDALQSGGWRLDREDVEDIWWSVAVTRA
ncbi:MAG TPA: 50S ribosomal protein L11 methyltransferase [Gemmatimonadaceae bacterium]|jgi:ribosomal protein L11 methyltransferase